MVDYRNIVNRDGRSNLFLDQEKEKIKVVIKLTKKEYKEEVCEILKGYRYKLGEEDIEELSYLITVIPFPKEGNPYVGLATRG